MKKITILLLLTLVTISFVTPIYAKGGGGRGGGGARSGGVRSGGTTAKSGTTAKTGTTNTVPKVNTKPVAGQTKTVKTAPKTVNGKKYSGTGNVVDENYKPTFKGGYTPPAGSTVYYRDSGSSWLNWFPLYYVMTHNGNSQAVVVQPDGKEQEVEQEGEDGMYFVNWILTILIALGLIGVIVYFVNKKTQGGGVAYD